MGWQRWGREKGTEENTFGEAAAEKVQHCRITKGFMCLIPFSRWGDGLEHCFFPFFKEHSSVCNI